MGVIVPIDNVQSALRWTSTGDSEEMISTLGFRDDGGAASLDLMAEDIYDAAISSFTGAAKMLSGWQFQGVKVQKAVGGGAFATGEHSVTVAGTSGGGSVPSNTGLLVRKITGQAGRAGVGRMYLPPAILDESVVNNNGVLTPAAQVAYQINVSAFFGALVAAGLQPVLFHSTQPLSTVITQLLVDNQVATQRRRMRR